MSIPYPRDLIGYAGKPPNPKWPGDARLAVNFVMNYEEGSEYSVPDGDGFSEATLTEAGGAPHNVTGRDLAAEGMFEYGSRVGFWRVMRSFEERGLPLTVFGCGLALERNPPAAAAIRAAGFDVCSHGWRWVKHYELSEAEEREHIRRAVASIQQTIGERGLLDAEGMHALRRVLLRMSNVETMVVFQRSGGMVQSVRDHEVVTIARTVRQLLDTAHARSAGPNATRWTLSG